MAPDACLGRASPCGRVGGKFGRSGWFPVRFRVFPGHLVGFHPHSPAPSPRWRVGARRHLRCLLPIGIMPLVNGPRSPLFRPGGWGDEGEIRQIAGTADNHRICPGTRAPCSIVRNPVSRSPEPSGRPKRFDLTSRLKYLRNEARCGSRRRAAGVGWQTFSGDREHAHPGLGTI